MKRTELLMVYLQLNVVKVWKIILIVNNKLLPQTRCLKESRARADNLPVIKQFKADLVNHVIELKIFEWPDTIMYNHPIASLR